MKNNNGLTGTTFGFDSISGKIPGLSANPMFNRKAIFQAGISPKAAKSNTNSVDALDDLFDSISVILSKFLSIAAYIGVRLVIAAILWLIISYIFPQLREAMPNFYKTVDLIVGAFDSLVGWLFKLFGI